MKKVFFTLVMLIASSVNIFSLNWGNLYWNLNPSLLPKYGESYGYFNDSRFPTVKYEIYIELDLLQNAEWVYIQWMQDHGWWLDRNKIWQGDSRSIDPINGALYIDPYEKIAIYFNTNGSYSIYRVRVLSR